MSDTATLEPLIFAPFVSSKMHVEPQWIDYNGHLNMAYYNVLLDRAVDEAFGLVGLGPDYLSERNASYFVAECHVTYRRELQAQEATRATLQLIDFDEKRLHYYMELRHATGGWVSATSEALALHVDMATRKVSSFPDDILAGLERMKMAHMDLPTPDVLGRVIGIPRKEGSLARTPASADH